MFEEVTIGACRLICGDAREVLPTLGPVESVITDPPYGVAFTGKRALCHGTYTTFRPGRYSHHDTADYVEVVILPVLVQCRALASCVALTPGTREMWRYPQPDDMGCFFSAAGTGMGRWGFTCCHPILYYGKDPYLAKRLGSRPNSCGQTYPNDANKIDHPCAKPLPMMLWLVQRASLAGMTVLDPFMGSGTTGVACVKLGRAFIGIDIERQYFDLACQRIEEACAQGDMLVPPVAPPAHQLTLEARP